MARPLPVVLEQAERTLRKIKLVSTFLISVLLVVIAISIAAVLLDVPGWGSSKALVVALSVGIATVAYVLWIRAFLIRARKALGLERAEQAETVLK